MVGILTAEKPMKNVLEAFLVKNVLEAFLKPPSCHMPACTFVTVPLADDSRKYGNRPLENIMIELDHHMVLNFFP